MTEEKHRTTIESVYSCWGCGSKGKFIEAKLVRGIRTDDGEITHLKLYFKCKCGRYYGETFLFRWHEGGELPPNWPYHSSATTARRNIDD